MTDPSGYVRHNPGQGPRIGTEAFYAWVSGNVRFELEARPWTLVALDGGELLVAARRTFWMRCVTSWLNIGRRREALRRDRLVAAKLAELNRRLLEGEPLEDGTK